MNKPEADLLQIWPECRECIRGMIRDSFSMSQSGGNMMNQQIQAFAEDVFAESYQKGWSSPVTANKILRQVKRLIGVTDAYTAFKRRELSQARKIFEQVKTHVGRDLRSAIDLSVLGNSLDFFTDPDEALLSLPEVLHKGISFAYDDIDQLERFLLMRPNLVLFLTDNSGEVFFDIPFFGAVGRHAERTVLVVKGGPSLNDLTRLEIENEQLTSCFSHVADTGTDGVGIDWDLTSAEFKDLVTSADLIISKGMANFETVYPKALSANVFFLLKAKCSPIQNYLGVPATSYCALWKEGGH